MNDDHQDIEDADEIGIPKEMRVKRRKYTMSPAALEQRRNAAQQPKPGMQGVRNNFKHGQHAKTFLGRLKPCKSTCEHYPCELVSDGATAPGGDCLDKAEVLQMFKAVHTAMKNPKDGIADFQEIAALNIANNITILEMLQEDIMRDGTVVKSTKETKFGTNVEYKMHPSLLALPKLMGELGMTPDNFMITPKAQDRSHNEKEAIRSISDMFGTAGSQLKAAREKKKGTE